jgi:hypothetical protein
MKKKKSDVHKINDSFIEKDVGRKSQFVEALAINADIHEESSSSSSSSSRKSSSSSSSSSSNNPNKSIDGDDEEEEFVEPLMNIKDYIREQSMYMRDFNGEDLE